MIPRASRSTTAYDAARGTVVLFGGLAEGALGDTWEWDGSSWTQRTPANVPPPRFGHAMVYDATRQRVVLFGGATGAGPATTFLSDTWEWNGQIWRPANLMGASPGSRWSAAMAFDAARGKTVLFGGRRATPNTLAVHRVFIAYGGFVQRDTWEWDGTAWTQRSTPASPPARIRHVMAYDPARGGVIVLGGYGPRENLASPGQPDIGVPGRPTTAAVRADIIKCVSVRYHNECEMLS